MCYFCGSSVFWKLGYHEPLDPLIGFLAYLGPKLWPTNQKLDTNSNPTKENVGRFG